MDHFSYRNRILHCEDVPVRELAETYGTPLFVYSKATLLHHLGQFQKAFAAVNPLICYSIKTNGNLHLCRLMAEAGAGFDVTSGGELYRALNAGGSGDKIVFAGVGKTDAEIRYALENDVFLFNVESEAELHNLAEVAAASGKIRRRGPARQSRPAAQDARQDRYQRQGRQVRTRHRHDSRRGPAASSAIRMSASSACTCTLARRSSAPSPIRKAWRKG